MSAEMTTEERRLVRHGLIVMGFMRTQPITLDDGHGRYTETFYRGDNIVTIEWGPKRLDGGAAR